MRIMKTLMFGALSAAAYAVGRHLFERSMAEAQRQQQQPSGIDTFGEASPVVEHPHRFEEANPAQREA